MLPSNRNLPPGRPGNSSGWIFAGPWANLGDMKSAYELAMERLSKTAPASKLTQAQKAELAELDSIYAAKLAQADLSTREALQAAQAAGDLETLDLLRQRYASDKAKLEAEREAKKDRVRGV
ncbi:MAG: hypothetical protein RLZZ356_1340 [Verrucomicrobiota bacterium]